MPKIEKGGAMKRKKYFCDWFDQERWDLKQIFELGILGIFLGSMMFSFVVVGFINSIIFSFIVTFIIKFIIEKTVRILYNGSKKRKDREKDKKD